MDISQIKILIDSINLGSFSKSAEKFSYTPSALSHIADNVEKELGVQILERDYKGITLTKAGKTLFPYLNALVSAEAELFSAANRISTKKQTLVIGCYASISNHILPEMLKNFKKLYPEIQVSVMVCDNIAEMTVKKADLFFISSDEKRMNAGYEWINVYKDKYCAVVPANYFIGKKTLTKKDFSIYPFIMPKNVTLDKTYSTLASEIISIEATDDGSVISMVKNELGISVLPALSLKNLPDNVKILDVSPELTRNIGVAYYEKAKNPAVKKFIRFISE